MTVEDFIFNITNKFVSKNDHENKIFYTDILNFVDSCLSSSYQDIYNHITMTHKYQTIPRMAMLWKYAKDNDLLKQKEKDEIVNWCKCTNCGTEYSKEGKGCPNQKCKSPEYTRCIGESAPNSMVLVHEDCYYCTIYPESIKKSNEKKCYGADCSKHGTMRNPKLNCGKCECEECCKQVFMFNEDPKGTIEKYRTTELAQPWLKETQALPEIAQAMLDDMLRNKRR